MVQFFVMLKESVQKIVGFLGELLEVRSVGGLDLVSS